MSTLATARPLIGPRHALGHAAIDVDHFAIAEAWAAVMHSAPIALPLRIARLRKVMRTHFDNEAALVEAAGTAFCRCHRQEHDEMIAICDEALAQSERKPRTARSILRRALPPIVRGHIDSMDQIAVLIINSAAEQSMPELRRQF
jgi:hemerythrin